MHCLSQCHASVVCVRGLGDSEMSVVGRGVAVMEIAYAAPTVHVGVACRVCEEDTASSWHQANVDDLW